eukprot:CAMPEP_0198358376 /NCGR_PEP_ID=MMETSP1450-20131203/130445_1 /TAXON_ID=753684 ORGANISM="Madagascaria erythrocladiodes, Strain CCMP3234" /NCGR_SAMPLE_ID=MMETSP1450 /ASSEMBLY_ACC=CAM_ASM_001115 /LENGTH=41 /DNA_ID= /DNA_START= /DNA_END= /DNA_ORIENTATION=
MARPLLPSNTSISVPVASAAARTSLRSATPPVAAKAPRSPT